MLSVFPEILFLAPLSAFILRLAAAGILASAAWRHTKTKQAALTVFGSIEGTVALLLTIGAWTQPAALAAAAAGVFWLIGKETRPVPTTTIILFILICVSLVLSGPGPFAFDLPL